MASSHTIYLINVLFSIIALRFKKKKDIYTRNIQSTIETKFQEETC